MRRVDRRRRESRSLIRYRTRKDGSAIWTLLIQIVLSLQFQHQPSVGINIIRNVERVATSSKLFQSCFNQMHMLLVAVVGFGMPALLEGDGRVFVPHPLFLPSLGLDRTQPLAAPAD